MRKHATHAFTIHKLKCLINYFSFHNIFFKHIYIFIYINNIFINFKLYIYKEDLETNNKTKTKILNGWQN